MRPITYKQFVLTAGQRLQHALAGSVLIVTSATLQFFVSFDNREDLPVEAGFVVQPGQFRTLTFYNPQSSSITIQIYVGNAELNYLGSDLMRNRPTVIKPREGSGVVETMAGLNEETLLGTWGGRTRKQIIIWNGSANLDLHIYKDYGTPGSAMLAVIPGRTSWTLETSDDLVLYNPNADDASVAILENFYA